MTERQSDRGTERQSYRATERQSDRATERQRKPETKPKRNRIAKFLIRERLCIMHKLMLFTYNILPRYGPHTFCVDIPES